MYEGIQGGVSVLPNGSNVPMVGGGLMSTSPMGVKAGGGNKKKKPMPTPAHYDMGGELKKYGNTPLEYDNGGTPTKITKAVATKLGIKPSLLLSSAWQEGMNKAALNPEGVSEDYNKANISGDYPIDGFLNYGVDTIGDKWDKVKKYLPPGFEKNMQFYDAVNEKGQKVKTAAFTNNESALMAKAAMMKNEGDAVAEYAKKKGVELDDKAKDYFMLAAYNGGAGNAQKMLDEYAASPDKAKFIDEGQTAIKGVHKNIKTRLDNMKIADEILNTADQ